MSTSLIYRAFGLRGYDYVRQDFIAGNIILKVQPKDDLIRCPCCHSKISFATASPRDGFKPCLSSPSGWSFPYTGQDVAIVASFA